MNPAGPAGSSGQAAPPTNQHTDPWAPHISVAYSNRPGSAAPIIAAVGNRLPDLEVTFRSLSLVAQVQLGRSWQWRTVAEIEFGQNRPRPGSARLSNSSADSI